MTWEIGITLLGGAITLLNSWMTLRMKLELSERREQDRENDRRWLEERFMARAELEARLKALEGVPGKCPVQPLKIVPGGGRRSSDLLVS